MSDGRTKMLIKIVKANPLLWKKSDKNYCNACAKEAAWKSVGAMIIPPMTGQEASTRFKSLRDTFNRHSKAEDLYLVKNPASKYVCTWLHYESMKFLKNEIKRRSTTTSFPAPTSDSNVGKAVIPEINCDSGSGNQHASTHTQSREGNNFILTQFQDSEGLKSAQIHESSDFSNFDHSTDPTQKSGDTEGVYLINVPPELRSSQDSPNFTFSDDVLFDSGGVCEDDQPPHGERQKNQTTHIDRIWSQSELLNKTRVLQNSRCEKKETLLDALSRTGASRSSKDSAQSIEETSFEIKVPPLDGFAKKRNSDKQELLEALTMMARGSADAFKELVQKKESSEGASTNAFSVVEFALTSVPEERQLSCIIEMLQVAQRYLKK